MRRITIATLAVQLLLPSFASAQKGFEGVVEIRMGSAVDAATPMTATMWAKGNKSRIEMSGGPAAMTMIRDGAGRLIMLVPQQKKYYIMASSADQLRGANTKPVRIAKLGRSETIAGARCDWYRMGREGEQPAEVCVARGLGTLGADLSSANGGGWSTDADLKALRAEFGDEFFPLRQKDSAGKVIYEVTKVERMAVSDGRFAPPAGWSELVTPGAPRSKR